MSLTSTSQIDRISIFYNMDYWQKFIAECLNPYILQQRQSQNLSSVFIAFNFFQGSNIRIAFKYADESGESRTNAIHSLFNNYLQQYPAGKSDSGYVGNSLFMDFPNDSCQENLFNVRFNDPNIQLQLLISEKIIDVFSAGDCNGSSLFTFLLHVMLAFCKEWADLHQTDQYSRTKQILLERFGAASERQLNEVFQPYHELFLYNKDMVMGIYEDAVLNTSADNFWYQVRNEYRQYLERNIAGRRGMPSILLPLDLITTDQLGLNDQSLYSVYYLIKLISGSLS